MRTDSGFDLSFFPALETLAIAILGGWPYMPYLLPTAFSDPSFPPRLRTLAFANCCISGGPFMEGLTRYASNRKNTTSVWLRRVVIVDSREHIPTEDSIKALEEHVSVEVRLGKELPRDLT